MDTRAILPDDLLRAMSPCERVLASCLDADWSAPAADLAWDCRRTLDHMIDALALYSVHLATRTTERLPVPRNGDPCQSVAALLTLLGAMGSVLAEVARAAPPGTRAGQDAHRVSPLDESSDDLAAEYTRSARNQDSPHLRAGSLAFSRKPSTAAVSK